MEHFIHSVIYSWLSHTLKIMVNDPELDVRTATDRSAPSAPEIMEDTVQVEPLLQSDKAWKSTNERCAFLRQQLKECMPQRNAELASLEHMKRYCSLIFDAENGDAHGEDKTIPKLAAKARIHLLDYLEYAARASLGYPTLGVDARTKKKAGRLIRLLELYDTAQPIVQVDLTTVGSRQHVLRSLRKMMGNGELSELQTQRLDAVSTPTRLASSGSTCGGLLDRALQEELYLHLSSKLVRAMESENMERLEAIIQTVKNSTAALLHGESAQNIAKMLDTAVQLRTRLCAQRDNEMHLDQVLVQHDGNSSLGAAMAAVSAAIRTVNGDACAKKIATAQNFVAEKGRQCMQLIDNDIVSCRAPLHMARKVLDVVAGCPKHSNAVRAYRARVERELALLKQKNRPGVCEAFLAYYSDVFNQNDIRDYRRGKRLDVNARVVIVHSPNTDANNTRAIVTHVGVEWYHCQLDGQQGTTQFPREQLMEDVDYKKGDVVAVRHFDECGVIVSLKSATHKGRVKVQFGEDSHKKLYCVSPSSMVLRVVRDGVLCGSHANTNVRAHRRPLRTLTSVLPSRVPVRRSRDVESCRSMDSVQVTAHVTETVQPPNTKQASDIEQETRTENKDVAEADHAQRSEDDEREGERYAREDAQRALEKKSLMEDEKFVPEHKTRILTGSEHDVTDWTNALQVGGAPEVHKLQMQGNTCAVGDAKCVIEDAECAINEQSRHVNVEHVKLFMESERRVIKEGRRATKEEQLASKEMERVMIEDERAEEDLKDTVEEDSAALEGKKRALKEEKLAIEKMERVMIEDERAEEELKDTVEEDNAAVEERSCARKKETLRIEEMGGVVIENESTKKELKDTVEEDMAVVKERNRALKHEKLGIEEAERVLREDQRALEGLLQRVTKEEKSALEEEVRVIEQEKLTIKENQRVMEGKKRALEEENQLVQDQKRALEDSKRALEEEQRVLDNDKYALEEERRVLENDKCALEEEKRVLETVKDTLEKERRAINEEKAGIDEAKRAMETRKSALERKNSLMEDGRKTVKSSCTQASASDIDNTLEDEFRRWEEQLEEDKERLRQAEKDRRCEQDTDTMCEKAKLRRREEAKKVLARLHQQKMTYRRRVMVARRERNKSQFFDTEREALERAGAEVARAEQRLVGRQCLSCYMKQSDNSFVQGNAAHTLDVKRADRDMWDQCAENRIDVSRAHLTFLSDETESDPGFKHPRSPPSSDNADTSVTHSDNATCDTDIQRDDVRRESGTVDTSDDVTHPREAVCDSNVASGNAITKWLEAVKRNKGVLSREWLPLSKLSWDNPHSRFPTAEVPHSSRDGTIILGQK